MADTVAELTVRLGLDSSTLDAGAKAAVATLDRVGGAITSMAAQYQAATAVMQAGGGSTATLAQIGLKTSDAIRQEIMAISELKAQLPATDAATAALTARQDALWATLRKAEQGAFAEAAALGVLASQLANSGNANHVLAQAGVKTTAVLQAEIAAFDRLIAAAQGDSAATMQLAARKQALVAVLNAEQTALLAAEAAKKVTVTTEQALANAGIMTSAALQQQITTLKGLMVAAQGDTVALNQLRGRMDALTRGTAQLSGQAGSASFAVISLGQGFQDAGQFGMGMAQGIRAVTNNLQMSVQAMMMLTTQAGSAKAAMAAFWTAMKGPAGFLLAFGAITAAIEAIANASQGATGKVNGLTEALKEMLEIEFDFPKFTIGGVDMVQAVAGARHELEMINSELIKSSRFGQLTGMGLPFMAQIGAPEDVKKRIADIEAFIEAYGDTADKMKLAGRAANYVQGSVAGASIEVEKLDTTTTRTTEKVDQFAKSIQEAAAAFSNLFAAWPAMPVSEMEGRMEEISDFIREGIESGMSPDSATIQRLVGEWIGVAEQIEAKMAPLRAKAAGALNVGAMTEAFGGLPADDLGKTLEGMEQIETSGMRIGSALRDGMNAELEQTQILLNTMPLSVIDNLSGAIGESVGQILTLQGGLKDVWDNILSSIRNIIAEMATLIVKQEILNAVTGKGKFGESLKGLGGMTGLGALGTAGLALGGLGLLTTILSGSRNYSANSQNTTLYGGGSPNRRMAVEGVVLRSGDIEFSVSERRAVNARIGR